MGLSFKLLSNPEVHCPGKFGWRKNDNRVIFGITRRNCAWRACYKRLTYHSTCATWHCTGRKPLAGNAKVIPSRCMTPARSSWATCVSRACSTCVDPCRTVAICRSLRAGARCAAVVLPVPYVPAAQVLHKLQEAKFSVRHNFFSIFNNSRKNSGQALWGEIYPMLYSSSKLC